MSTKYPSAIDDTGSLKIVVDGVTSINASLFNDLRGAILNIESELGVHPAVTYGTVRARLDAIDDAITGALAGGVTIAGDLGGTVLSPKVIGIQGHPVSSIALSDGQTYVWNAGDGELQPGTGTFIASGDLAGDATSQTVVGIRGNPVISDAPDTNQAYVWNSDDNQFELQYMFTPGGDLSGNVFGQTVSSIQGVTISGTPAANYVLTATSSSAAAWSTIKSNVLSTTTAGAVIPAIAGTVALTVDSTAAIKANRVYFVTDGTHQMTCTATTITDSTHVTVTYWGAVGDVTGTLASGSKFYLVSKLVLSRTAASPLAFTIPTGDVDVTINVLSGSSGGTTVTLPAVPTVGQTIDVRPSTDAATNNVTVARNTGITINGSATNPAALATSRAAATASSGYTFTAISTTDWVM